MISQQKSFIFIIIIAFSSSLKIGHQNKIHSDLANGGKLSKQESQQSIKQKQAFSRLGSSALQNQNITGSFSEAGQSTDQKTQQLLDYLIKESSTSSQDSRWVSKLDKAAQIKLLKMVTSIPMTGLQNSMTRHRLAKQLLKDIQLDPSLKNIQANQPVQEKGHLDSRLGIEHNLYKLIKFIVDKLS